MILKKVFHPFAVMRYMQKELIFSTLITVLVFCLYELGKFKHIILPFSVSAILGSALAIFIAFRNNNSYGRWWEARILWGSILNNSRIFARQIIANADNAVKTQKISQETANSFKKEMIERQIAFAHALRLHLRKENHWQEIQHLLQVSEYQSLLSSQNAPNLLLLQQGIRIKEAIQTEILGGFDNISLEPTLAGFNNFQGACERIKNTPLLRQYHFFTQLFLQVFTIVLPFSLINDFDKLKISWLMIPITILIAFVFGVMAKVGEVNENPFENQITDVPMTALCNTIERDLKEMLGDTHLIPKLEVQNGYLM